jgi:phosphoserine aminotransferase
MTENIMARILNFSAGPAALPLAVLERTQAEFIDYQGCGTSVIEQSHRGPVYSQVHQEAIDLITELAGVPNTHQVLFLQGGASQQFAMLPMNFLPEGGVGSQLVTGTWSKKAYAEGKNVAAACGASIELANPNGELPSAFVDTQLGGQVSSNAAYYSFASNETIHGVQFGHEGSPWPEVDAPVFCDMSSDFLWQPLDVSRFDFIYAGAQKNIGPSGVVVCIVRKSLLERGRSDLPTIFQYRTHAEKDSMFNTPPTFAIYMIRNVLEWVRDEGGLAAMKTRNLRKANRLYDVIDSSDFFNCPVERGCRSTMNVVFRLPTEALEAQFLEESAAQGMSGLKGHRSVGGLRASIYNAAPYEWADGLGQFMTDFAARNG